MNLIATVRAAQAGLALPLPVSQPALGKTMGERTELRDWMRSSKEALNQACTGIFGTKASGQLTSGTGFLVRFRDILSLNTCDHVLRPIRGPIHFLPVDGRPHVHSGQCRYDARYDVGFLIPSPEVAWHHKVPLEPANAVFEGVSPGESVLVYGFPAGHASVQQGMVVVGNNVQFTSMTLLSVTEAKRNNSDLANLAQPTIRWKTGEMLDERLRQIGASLSASGFSGGPVFLAESRRLIGHVTHSDAASLYYTPIGHTFSAMDKSGLFVHAVS